MPSSRFRAVLWVLGSILLAVLVLSALKGYRDLRIAREREVQLQQEIRTAKARVEALHQRIEELRKDPVALEHLAREDLGLAHPDDIVIVLPKSSPPAAAPGTPPTPVKTAATGAR